MFIVEKKKIGQRKWHSSLCGRHIVHLWILDRNNKVLFMSLSPLVWREAMFSSNEIHQAASQSEKVRNFR